MKNYFLKRVVLFLALSSLWIISTAGGCSGSGSGSSSGGGGISNDASYEFSAVNLRYDFSEAEKVVKNPSSIEIDIIEMGNAHNFVGISKTGSITSLYDIIVQANNYEEPRKPHVTITFNTYTHNSDTVDCTNNNISGNTVYNLPNYGADIKTMLFNIRSIGTTNNNLQFRWSKAIDLNGEWWSSVQDRVLDDDGDAIDVDSYTKVRVDERTLYARRINDAIVIASYTDTELMNEITDCDVEITLNPDAVIRNPFSGGIFIDGEYNSDYRYSAPFIIEL